MDKGIIFYTDNRLEDKIFNEVCSILLQVGLPIVSVSLKPIKFGKNIVLDMLPGITTLTKQILVALENIDTKYVFFCEHDVLYSKTHFEFTPPRDDTFYFNVNVWRWDYPYDRFITYEHLASLSGMCANRELAVKHYKDRLNLIEKNSWLDTSREPIWIRKLGHEPGKNRSALKAKREEWRSAKPNIDIRHRGTITKRKCRLEDFRRKPTGWQEITWRPEI